MLSGKMQAFSAATIPPRIWRWALFSSSTSRTCPYRSGFSARSRKATSLCTVLLLIWNCFAAARTVVLCSMMNSPSTIARSSNTPFISIAPHVCVPHTIWGERGKYEKIKEEIKSMPNVYHLSVDNAV